MNCLLIAATSLEISPAINRLREDRGGMAVTDILIGGIGLTSTAYSLTKQLQLKKYDLVIQAGIAGCFDKKQILGSVFAIRQDAFADQGVIEEDLLMSLSDLKLLPANFFPYRKGLLINPRAALVRKTGVKSVNGISVNHITTSRKMINQYITKFNPVTESMEGAAAHFVCLMEKTAFIQLRSISNYVGERDKKKWKLKESIENLNRELIRLLESLQKGK